LGRYKKEVEVKKIGTLQKSPTSGLRRSRQQYLVKRNITYFVWKKIPKSDLANARAAGQEGLFKEKKDDGKGG